MDAIQTLGMITGVGTALAGALDNSAEKQQEYQLQLMRKQADYNNAAMDKQVAAQKEMYEYTGYGSKVRQLKEAGLNPGLIYGMGNAGGGVTGNTSALGVAGAGAPNVAQSKQANLQSIGMGLELAKLKSEIAVNESVAEANKADAEMKRGPETGKKLAETQNIITATDMLSKQINSEQIKQNGWYIDNDLKKVELEVSTNTKNANIDRINYLAEEAKGSMMKVLAEADSARAKARVDTSTIDTMINTYNARLDNILADTVVKWSTNKVNEEHAKQIVESVKQAWGAYQNETRRIYQNWNQLDQQQQLKFYEILQNNNAAMDRVQAQGMFNLMMKAIPNTSFGTNQSYNESYHINP